MAHHPHKRVWNKAIQRRKQKVFRRQEREQQRERFQNLVTEFGSGTLEENLQALENHQLQETRIRDGWLGTSIWNQPSKTTFIVKKGS